MDAFLATARSLRNQPTTYDVNDDRTISVYVNNGAITISYKTKQYDYNYYQSSDGLFTREQITKEKYKFGKREREVLDKNGFDIEKWDYFTDRLARIETMNGVRKIMD